MKDCVFGSDLSNARQQQLKGVLTNTVQSATSRSSEVLQKYASLIILRPTTLDLFMRGEWATSSCAYRSHS